MYKNENAFNSETYTPIGNTETDNSLLSNH